jgi:nucleoside-diphosphate-sugar epimerase
MNILITGASGFIGRHLVRRLAKTEDNIICLVRSEKKVRRYLPSNIRLVYADLGNYEGLRKELDSSVDMIFHCAGYVSNRGKAMLERVNVLGTENICRLALELKVKKFIYLSSVAVVSANRETPLVEETDYRASNPYGESKIKAERVVLDYRERGLKISILRPSMVYGEDEPHLLKLLLLLLRFRLYPILGRADNKFHLVYVESVVDAMIYAAEESSFTQEPVFIADKEVLSYREVVDTMAAAIGAPLPFRIPEQVLSILKRAPVLGPRLRMLLHDRWFSTERLLKTGFKYNYNAKESVSLSSKRMLFKKKTF